MPRPLYFKFQIRTNAARWLRRATSHCQPSEINVQSRALGLQGGLRPNGVHNFRWWNGNILRRCEPRWATPLRIYRRVFTKFLEVPSPPGKGEKVAGGRMRGLFAGSDTIRYLTALGEGCKRDSYFSSGPFPDATRTKLIVTIIPTITICA